MNKKYKEYLNSDQWKEIRDKVLHRDGNKCIKCGSSKNLQVHHNTYDNIYNEAENLDDLITLCSKCHMKEHDMINGVRVVNAEAIVVNNFISMSNILIMSKNNMKPRERIVFLYLCKQK